MPWTSDSGVASASVAGKARATSPPMLTRILLGWSTESATPDTQTDSSAEAARVASPSADPQLCRIEDPDCEACQ